MPRPESTSHLSQCDETDVDTNAVDRIDLKLRRDLATPLFYRGVIDALSNGQCFFNPQPGIKNLTPLPAGPAAEMVANRFSRDFENGRTDRPLDINLDSYTRLSALIAIHPLLPREEWLRLVGEWWCVIDNFRSFMPELGDLLSKRGPIREMMTQHENDAYDALPNTVKCYRGCDASFQKGLSWSLYWKTANAFPFSRRYRVRVPVVVTSTASKTRILALKLERQESEIITFSAKPIAVDAAVNLSFVEPLTRT